MNFRLAQEHVVHVQQYHQHQVQQRYHMYRILLHPPHVKISMNLYVKYLLKTRATRIALSTINHSKR